ncbi:NusA N-terminal domain-containing protein [Mesomycoplasma lagogenitalium]|uniref:Transcription termination/antitermination protein NusA n=1 Tax=Mesomycoplasma lagogenitalium TaxID=171286 RepID=A0ABY8LT09_9BACT|nr:NusA N-terminal domain-containing protein [Mesomycoplasma lagogenitalium]WGI36381.1 NusA N-terminal domain-containing protein [Mesomycoplasma lagogenitalium]
MARKQVKADTSNKLKKDFFKNLKEVAEFRKMDINNVVKILEDAFIKTITKDYDADAEIKLIVDFDSEDFRLVNENALVVSDEQYNNDIKENEGIQTCIISVSNAMKQYNKKVEEDDSIQIDILFESLPKSVFIPVQQQFKQKITELVREKSREKYLPLIGRIVKAKLISKSHAGYLYEIEDEDKTKAFMPKNLSSKKKSEMGIVEDVYLHAVLEETKDTQIIVSNSSNKILEEIIKREIPEINSGELKIVRIARQAGLRSKVAISSFEDGKTINDIGTVVGKKGNRIELISNELDNEKIDIIQYSDKLVEFVSNALSPARVISVLPLKAKKIDKFLVVVPDSQHTLAIGKKGINVTLAAELTRSKIDIIPYSKSILDKIKLIWNGNVSSIEEIDEIEKDAKNKSQDQKRNNKKPNIYNKSASRSKRSLNLMEEFDRDIQKYNEDFGNIEDQNNAFLKSTNTMDFNNKKQEVFDVDDIMQSAIFNFENETKKTSENQTYTQEELKQIQEEIKNYKMDNDLAAFAGLKDLDFDINDADWDDEE